MIAQIAKKPLALRQIQRVDVDQPRTILPVNQWNWTPNVKNPENLNKIIASGGNTTSKSTFSSQTDHGEHY